MRNNTEFAITHSIKEKLVFRNACSAAAPGNLMKEHEALPSPLPRILGFFLVFYKFLWGKKSPRLAYSLLHHEGENRSECRSRRDGCHKGAQGLGCGQPASSGLRDGFCTWGTAAGRWHQASAWVWLLEAFGAAFLTAVAFFLIFFTGKGGGEPHFWVGRTGDKRS